MRVTVTVVQQGDEPRDVLLAVDENPTAADVAGALATRNAPAGGGAVVQLFPSAKPQAAPSAASNAADIYCFPSA